MRDLAIIAITYPLFLTLQVALDAACGWAIADGFGKERP